MMRCSRLSSLRAARSAAGTRRHREVGRPGQGAAHGDHHRRDRLRSAGRAGPLLEHDQLGDLRPALRVRLPRAAAQDRAARGGGMPEISADGLTWKISIRKGIYFADDPVFKGSKRELTAHDFVYSMKRLVDPKVRSPNVFLLRGKLAGLDEAVGRRRAGQARLRRGHRGPARARPLHAADQARRARLHVPAVPHRDADRRRRARGDRGVRRRERLGDGQSGRHRRRSGSRNGGARSASCSRPIPNYREETFPALPANADADARAAHAAMKGKRLPQIGRVEIAVIEESNPRLLAFNSNELDLVDVPRDLVSRVLDDSEPAAAGVREAGRHAAARAGGGARVLRVLQHERPGRRRLHAGEGRAAPRDPHGLQPGRADQVGLQGQGTVADAAHPARGARPRRRDQEQHAATIPRSRARCSTSSATRTATATASASCPTASR